MYELELTSWETRDCHDFIIEKEALEEAIFHNLAIQTQILKI